MIIAYVCISPFFISVHTTYFFTSAIKFNKGDVNIYQPKKAYKKRGSHSKRGVFESTESFSNINDMYTYPIQSCLHALFSNSISFSQVKN